MKRKTITALAIALALAVMPFGGHFATFATASSNNTVDSGSGTVSGNDTTPGGDTGTTPGGDTGTTPGGDTGTTPGGGTGTTPGGGTDTTPGGGTASGNNTNPGSASSVSASQDRFTGVAITVTNSLGETLVSTIGTVNTSSSVSSVAMATSRTNVNAAAGLTSDMAAAGQSVILTVADSQCGELARQAIQNAAASLRSSVAAILEIDLDIYQANGALEREVTQLSSPVQIVISTPSNVENPANYDFAIVRIHDSVVDILPDLDNDSQTITFATDRFSVYAVIYGEKGSFDAFAASAAGVRDSVPKTGETYPVVIPFALTGIALAGAAVVLGRKKQA